MSPSGTYLESEVLDRVVDVLLSRTSSVALALTDAAVRAATRRARSHVRPVVRAHDGHGLPTAPTAIASCL